jgi:EmrB/QacA subfamily drug resistance transporter
MTDRERYRYKWWALAGVCLLAFTAFLDFTIVNTALPFIQVDLKTTIFQLQWVANIFAIILGMTMISVGKIADLIGKKKIFYSGALIFSIAAFGAGASPNPQCLIFFRGLQALGASILFIVSATALTDVFPEKERVRAVSIWGGCTGFGLVIGPFLGGIIVALLGWRWVFWINLPIIFIGLALCSFSLKAPDREHPSVKIDWIGFFLLVFGLGTLMYGIIEAAQTDWTSTVGWFSLLLGLVVLVTLILFDLRKKTPLLSLGVFKKKIIALAALSCSIGGVVAGVFMFFDPLYLRVLREFSPMKMGLLIAVIPMAQVLTSLTFDQLLKWLGSINLLFISCAAGFAGVVLHLFFGEETPVLYLILPFFLLGINWALSNVAMVSAVNQTLPEHQTGEVIGTIATIWNVVAAVLLALSTAVFHAIEVKSSFLPAFHGAVILNILYTGCILLAAIVLRCRIKSV